MKKKSMVFTMLATAWLGLVTSCSGERTYEIYSPDNDLKVMIQPQEDGCLTYSFTANGTELIRESALGFKLESQELVPAVGWKIENVSNRKVREDWKPLWGKRSVVKDHFNELVFDLSNPSGKPERMQLLVRSYDDGIAFRYQVPGETGESVKVESELTAYNFVGDYTAWFYNKENHNIGPEKLSETDSIRLPIMIVQAGEEQFMAIHEADLVSGEPLVLQSKEGETLFSVASKPKTLEPGYTSAWRVIMYGEKPGDLVDSHLIDLLNPDPDPA